MNKIIEIENLTKNYGKVKALKGVTLDVNQGEVFGFLGPNGAGKTTMIRCMLDMIRPQGGSIRVLGYAPQKDPVAVRAKVGYLPGELNLDGNLKVSQVLHYFNDLRGNQLDWGRVKALAAQLELDLNVAIKNMSKGNKQKVGVVQALMHRPELLILDEPTSGLDPLMQHQVYRLLKEANREGATIFFSSHIIKEVEGLANRIAIIRDGVIVEEADPSQLMTMEMRRIRVRFIDAVPEESLAPLAQFSKVHRERQDMYSFQVKGEVDGFIKALAAYPIADLDVERPSLEEVFLTYYAAGGKE